MPRVPRHHHNNNKKSTLKEQLPVLSTGSRASTPLQKEADGIRSKLEELGEDTAEVLYEEGIILMSYLGMAWLLCRGYTKICDNPRRWRHVCVICPTTALLRPHFFLLHDKSFYTYVCLPLVVGEQAAASLKADLAKLTSSAATEVEEELSTMAARRKELASKNVREY